MPLLIWLPLSYDLISQPTEPVSAHHPGDTDVEMAYESEPYNNDQGDFNFGLDNAYSPGSVPEVEIRRDVAAHGLSPASHPPFAAQQHNVRVEEGTGTLNEKEPTFPNFDEEMLHSRGHSTFELRSGSPRFAGSEEEHENFGEQNNIV